MFQLTKVATDLQRESGDRVDFDTAIAFLIDHYFEKKKNSKLNLKII